ncbi:MAG: FxLYD domain-containing protein, partial [Firmicutes bacterium]|nr:FxLYD domain-containing protein [Bacillota bacterium]
LSNTERSLKGLLDSLFVDESMEVSADIEVLDSILDSSGEDFEYIKRYCRYCGARMSPVSSNCTNCGTHDELLEKELKKAARSREPLSKRIWDFLFKHAFLIACIFFLSFFMAIYGAFWGAEKYFTHCADRDLVFSAELREGYSYITLEGTVTNEGNMSHEWVKIEICFLDNESNVVDTESFYVITDELGPTKAKKFSTMVKKDEKITSYTIDVIEAGNIT